MPNGKPMVPPGGFSGFAQQTPAVQALLRKKTTRKKRRKKVAKKRPTKRRAVGVGARGKPSARAKVGRQKGRLVKGSPAAKRRMAQLRKMRKK